MSPPPFEADDDDDNQTLADVIGKKRKESPGPSLLWKKVHRTDSVE